jgi:hypothetical protein
MNKLDCKLERVSNFTIGMVLLLIGLGFTLIGVAIIPVLGLVIAVPVLILAGIFLAAPRSKACTVLIEKARGAFSK